MIEREFTVEGMHCTACVGLVSDEVSELDGVERVAVDLEGGRASVYFDPSRVDEARIVAAIREAGYQASVRS